MSSLSLRFEQPCVLDGDGGLVCDTLAQCDLCRRERPRMPALPQFHIADDVAFDLQGNEQAALDALSLHVLAFGWAELGSVALDDHRLGLLQMLQFIGERLSQCIGRADLCQALGFRSVRSQVFGQHGGDICLGIPIADASGGGVDGLAHLAGQALQYRRRVQRRRDDGAGF